MINIETWVFLLFTAIMFKTIAPILGFLVCFYIGFRLVCNDEDGRIENAIKEYLSRKLREIKNIIE